MKNYFRGLAVCDVPVCLRRFVKALCRVDNADIQDYVPAQKMFTVFFIELTTVGKVVDRIVELPPI